MNSRRIILTTYTGSPNSSHPNSNASSSQGQNSGSQPERSSQTPAVPQWPREKSSINSLLNDPVPDTSKALTTKDPQLTIAGPHTAHLLRTLVERTSGCSVEQLEQVHSALMSEIWTTRGDWDRARVALNATKLFDNVMEDIRRCQRIAAPSMDIDD